MLACLSTTRNPGYFKENECIYDAVHIQYCKAFPVRFLLSFADWLCFLWSVLLDFILYSCTLLEITEFPLNIQTYKPQCKYKHVAKLYHSGRAGEMEVITCAISIGPSCGKHAAIGQRPPQVSDAL